MEADEQPSSTKLLLPLSQASAFPLLYHPGSTNKPHRYDCLSGEASKLTDGMASHPFDCSTYASFLVRINPLKVQDRLIRLEEQLRMNTLLPGPLRERIPELTEKQLVALRFCF